MRIRSATIGTNMRYPLEDGRFHTYASFQERIQAAFGKVGLEVQTVRLAAQPFPQVLADVGPDGAAAYACQLERLCQTHGLDYCSIGPVVATQPDAELGWIEAIPEVIAHTEAAFASILVAERASGINLSAIARAAQVICDVAQIEPSGFGNLRLAVLANCEPGSPFFPASYHMGTDTAFSIATESADLAVESYARAKTLDEARANLREAVEEVSRTIERVCQPLASEYGFRFGGIDFSLAPYPETARSIGHAIEQLGVDAFGANSTFFATAFTTRVLREAQYHRCGFSGLMFPVLEDRTMAERSAEGLYSLDSLLLYSAVCGTGLDTVPLPGAVSVEELAAILLDMSTLALVADKPLTARLMPIPGKVAGEMTDFDFPYFANGRILDIKGRGGASILSSNGFVRL